MVESTNYINLVIIIATLSGLLVGSAQWILLRKYSVRYVNWVFLTVLGFLAAHLLGLWLPSPFRSYPFFNYLISGIFIGSTQALILRRKFDFSGYWILANVIAVIIEGLFVSIFPHSLNQNTFLGIFMSVIDGLIFGSITGLFLVRLIKLNEGKKSQ